MNNNIKYQFSGKPVGLFGELGKTGKGLLLFGTGAGLLFGAKHLADINKETFNEGGIKLPFAFEYKRLRRR